MLLAALRDGGDPTVPVLIVRLFVKCRGAAILERARPAYDCVLGKS